MEKTEAKTIEQPKEQGVPSSDLFAGAKVRIVGGSSFDGEEGVIEDVWGDGWGYGVKIDDKPQMLFMRDEVLAR